MARLTYAEIRTTGGLEGGNDSVDSHIKTKMNAWLRKHYAQYPWPFLNRTAISATLASGATSMDVGAGNNAVTPQIVRVYGPIYWRDATSVTNRGKANISQLLNQDLNQIAAQYDSSITGSPLAFTYTEMQTAAGLKYVTIVPYPRPDKAYLLTFMYQYLPDDLQDTDVPLWPNEQTLIQCAKVQAIGYDNANTAWYKEESETLASMVAADRDAHGGNASFGDKLQLDPVNFGGNDDSPTTKLPWY